MANNNLQYKNTKIKKYGELVPCRKGSVKIDGVLTLWYEIHTKDGGTHYTNVYSDARGESGFYYECEDILESLELAKSAIDNFVNLVKINPSKYYPPRSFKLIGTFRKQNAIGESEKFRVDSIAQTPLLAMIQTREEMYADGYELILFKKVLFNGEEIPMMKALELE